MRLAGYPFAVAKSLSFPRRPRFSRAVLARQGRPDEPPAPRAVLRPGVAKGNSPSRKRRAPASSADGCSGPSGGRRGGSGRAPAESRSSFASEGGGGRLLDVVHEDLHRRAASLRTRAAGQEPVADGPERVDVRPPVDVRRAEPHLRRHVSGSAGDHARDGQLALLASATVFLTRPKSSSLTKSHSRP